MKQQREIDEIKAKSDMTYDEFLIKYLDHIEGRAENEERRPITAEGAESN